jgi:glutathione S-transferase
MKFLVGQSMNLLAFCPALISAFVTNHGVVARDSSRLHEGFFDELVTKSPTYTQRVYAPDDFQVPEPKPLTVTEGTDLVGLLKSSAALAVRLGTGAFVLGWKIDSLVASQEEGKYSLKLGPFNIRDSSSVLSDAPRPSENLILYEYDASPFCKRVRETINLLDLTVEFRPCPGARQGQFSQELYARTGRRTVPYLIDPNNGVEMFESGAIIEYLLETYGPSKDAFDRKALWPITFEKFSLSTSTIVARLRDMPGATRQATARPDNEKMRPIEVWGYECSPFVRPVLEKLCTLCVPHVMVSCSRGSANRDRLVQRTGKQFQVPFLVDPNTGVELFESTAICDYLEKGKKRPKCFHSFTLLALFPSWIQSQIHY